MDLLAELQNYYDEFNGKGLNPKEYSLDDFEQRKRGRAFTERQAARALALAKKEEAIAKLRNSNDRVN